MISEQEQIKMFGCTIKDMIEARPSFIGEVMYAMQILSDAQEILSRGQNETARQYINKAKYFLSEVHKKEREQERNRLQGTIKTFEVTVLGGKRKTTIKADTINAAISKFVRMKKRILRNMDGNSAQSISFSLALTNKSRETCYVIEEVKNA